MMWFLQLVIFTPSAVPAAVKDATWLDCLTFAEIGELWPRQSSARILKGVKKLQHFFQTSFGRAQ